MQRKNESRSFFDYQETTAVLNKLILQYSDMRFDATRNKITVFDETGEKCLRVQLPVLLPCFKSLTELQSNYPDKNGLSVIIILIQVGNAAVGLFQNARLNRHKVIRKYMVRKTQGRAQISYLKTKGKSRLGSRIRLKQSQIFFEEISDLLAEFLHGNKVDRILFSSTPELLGLLFQQKNLSRVITKNDERLIKIPYDVGVPSAKEIERISNLVVSGYIEEL